VAASPRSNAYVRELRGAQPRGSMGDGGACADDQAMDQFCRLLQKHVQNPQAWQTREQRCLAIIVWLEGTYKRWRR
jgi:hypothetical protein